MIPLPVRSVARNPSRRVQGESSPSPCGGGVGGGMRRHEIKFPIHATTLRCARATPPHNPLPQGEGENYVPAIPR